MSSAPTPAPHVPVNFLKAGGTTFFSARCIALLAQFGYEADDFGSYDHVADRLRTSRERCAAYDKALAAGKSPPPPQPPTRRERELGAPIEDQVNHYQSGHLGMNSCYQNERDNPCSNFVYGHDMGTYPCMPHQGSAEVAGTEHNRWTAREIDVPLSRPGAKPRGPYAGDVDADADARTRSVLAERGRRPQPTGAEVPSGAAPAGAAAGDPSAASGPGGASGADASKPTMRESDKITGDDAAECINNFRKGAEAGMRAHASSPETIAKNRAAAGTAAERDAARAAATRAERAAEPVNDELRKANQGLGGYTTSVTKATAAAGGVPTRAQAADIDRRQATLDQATADRDAISARADTANEAASTARGRATTMNNAHCRAEQGERIQEGASGELGPRNPNRWDSLPRDRGETKDDM